MTFEDLGLIEPLLQAVRGEGYVQPTPIQEEAIGHLLAGRDLLGCAQTGTGKTAAFALPILQRLEARKGHHPQHGRNIRVLVVTPTRELAAQIGQSFSTYGRHLHWRNTVVYGGVHQRPQVHALRNGVDILVATPGRLLDLMQQGFVRLRHVEVLVLDEADRMFDMGFIHDVRRIVAAVPVERQTMLFSATMPKSILHLAATILRDPVEIRITPEAPAAETVAHAVYLVEKPDKQNLLNHLLAGEEIRRALVFARTKRGADRVALHLQHAGFNAQVIHSDKPQKAREKALDDFKSGRTRVLVASDIASRGLDIDDVSHVINFDMPQDAETYIHRIGRTGRAGQAGKALSFCGLEERPILREIEQLIHKPVPSIEEHPFRSAVPRRPARKVVTRFPASWRRLGRRRAFGRR